MGKILDKLIKIFGQEKAVEKEKEITLREFNSITAENVMKPHYIQPKKGNFKFSKFNSYKRNNYK